MNIDTSTTNTNNSNDVNPYISFQAGVTAVLRSWSALRTAVEQSWGGPSSHAKAEDLRSNIFHYYHDGNSTKAKIMDAYDLEDNLLSYMEEEFGVVLEDGSEVEIANLICTMYEACVGRGDVTLAHGVVQNAMRAEEAMKASNVKSVFQSGQEDIEDGDSCNDDDDDDDDDDEIMDEDCDIKEMGDGNINQASMQLMDDGQIASRISMEQIFACPPTKPKKEMPPPRQLGEPEPEKPQPVVDEDGFAMVPTKKKAGSMRSN